MSDELVKIHASLADATDVAKQLLTKAQQPSDVQVTKTGGFGYIVPKSLADKVSADAVPVNTVGQYSTASEQAPVALEQESETVDSSFGENAEGTDFEDSSTFGQPKRRGRPPGSKNKLDTADTNSDTAEGDSNGN